MQRSASKRMGLSSPREAQRLYYERMQTRYPPRPLTLKRQREVSAIVRQLVDSATERNVKLSRVDLCEQLDLGYTQVVKLCLPTAILPAQHAVVDAKVKVGVLLYVAEHPLATITEVVKHFNSSGTRMGKVYYSKVRRILAEANKTNFNDDDELLEGDVEGEFEKQKAV